MRLLDTRALINDGRANLVEYVDERKLPPYAILSHTWGEAGEEVLFGDLSSGLTPWTAPSSGPDGTTDSCSCCYCKHRNATAGSEKKAGWNKVYKAAQRARLDGYDFVWIDTCCIDKSSSAELSEAINSMFRWYQNAAACYVYLVDFELSPVQDDSADKFSGESTVLGDEDAARLRQCRWFVRGWTLQELIAPNNVLFYDASWTYISRKRELFEILENITGIHQAALRGWSVSTFSIAQRMCWASTRETTRVEDEAYSLLGLFNINMPLLYGEGRRAFHRLQEAILSVTTDTSIFAWELRVEDDPDGMHDLFAPSAAHFWWHAREIEYESPKSDRFTDLRLTNQGLHISLGVHQWRRTGNFMVVFAVLNCVVTIKTLNGDVNRYAIGLRIRNRALPQGSSMLVTHVHPEKVSTLEEDIPSHRRLVLLENEQHHALVDPNIRSLLISNGYIPDTSARVTASPPAYVRIQLRLPKITKTRKWRILSAYPHYQWHARDRSFLFSMASGTSFGALVIEIEKDIRCRIIVGFSRDRPLIDPLPQHETGYLQYWIFSCCHQQESSDIALSRAVKQVATFASKDMFEKTNIRQRANKAIVLPNNDLLRISPTHLIPPRSVDRKNLRYVELRLELTVSPEQGRHLFGLPDHDKLRTYHDMSTSTKSALQRPLDLALALNMVTDERIMTYAWYLQRKEPFATILLGVKFECVTLGRKLWTGENVHVLESVFDANLTDAEGRTPLWLVLQEGPISLPQLLMDHGRVNLNSKDIFGDTPLVIAAKDGDESITKLLLDTGQADVNVADNRGQTPLIHAAKNGHTAVARLLLDTDKINVNYMDEALRTPLAHAVINGYTAIARLLLDVQDIKAGLASRTGTTPLHWAASEGHKELVQMLLQTGGVDPNVIDFRGRSPIAYAAEGGFVAVVEVLCGRGDIDIDIRDSLGQTPLSIASEKGNQSVVQQLLDTVKADPEAIDTFGRTPFMLSGRSDTREPSEAIIDAIASKTDQSRRDILEAAIRRRDLLGCSFIHFCGIGNSSSNIELALEYGVDINSSDDEGWTPLHWCAYFGSRDAARLLLHHDASRTIKDHLRQTAYDIALHSGNVELAGEVVPEGQNLEEKLETRVTKGEYLYGACDSCSHHLYGEQHHCTTCPSPPGYDLCFRCIRSAYVFHPQHSFQTNFRYKTN